MKQAIDVAAARSPSLPANARGILWALCAAGSLALMLTLIKLLGQGVPVAQILFIRQAIIFLVALPAIALAFPGSITSSRHRLHLLRVLLSLSAMLAGYTAIVHLPLADYTALTFSRAFFVTIFAIWFLGEIVDGRRWMATIIGFVGVLIMLRPGQDGADIYALLAIFGAACVAGVSVILRMLTRTESPTTILTYQAVAIGVLIAPFAAYVWVDLSVVQWLQAVGIGLLGALAQMSSIRAFRSGQAAVVAPIDYTKLIWTSAIGFVLFSELPQGHTLLGAAIIVIASLYVLIREVTHAPRPGLDRAGPGDRI